GVRSGTIGLRSRARRRPVGHGPPARRQRRHRGRPRGAAGPARDPGAAGGQDPHRGGGAGGCRRPAPGTDRDRRPVVLVVSLGVAFGICFLTGLLSHLIQHPPGWFVWPARPAGLYRVTQGLHVATGIAAIPLLLVKLWTVYPKLFRWPPFNDVVDLLERASLLPLISGAIFLLV